MVKDNKNQKPVTSSEVKPDKIMTLPLPQILNGIEDSIRLADKAAKDARKAGGGGPLSW